MKDNSTCAYFSQIVPQYSAVLPGIDSLDLNCTHSQLSKFASPIDPRFQKLWLEVKRLVFKARQPQVVVSYESGIVNGMDEQLSRFVVKLLLIS
jgi:hypothetical protein